MSTPSPAGANAGPATSVVACPGCGRRNRVPAVAAGRPRCARCKQPLPWLVDAGDDDFAAVADRAPVPVLVDCWAPWCGPCRVVGPLVERMATRFAGRLKVVKVDVDRAPGVARRFDVRGIPTLLVLDGGALVDRLVGAPQPQQLESWLEAALAGT